MAEAQIICGSSDAMIERLEKSYDESQTGLGLHASGALYEIWTSDAGTWTLLITRPYGMACIVADGQHWQDRDAPDRVNGSPV